MSTRLIFFSNLICLSLLILIIFSQRGIAELLSNEWQETGFPYIQNYSPKEYKNNPQNWCIVQDERGIMYFGNYGVLVFDGVYWKHVRTRDTAVRSMAVSNNTVYVGAQSDLGYLEPDETGKLHFKSLLDSIPAKYHDFQDVWRTYAIGDEIYFQTFNYIFRWSNGRMGVLQPSKDKFHISFAVNNSFFVREWDTGLMKLEGDLLRLIPGGEQFSEERIMFMLAFDHQRILVGTVTKGLFLYDGNSFLSFPTKADSYLKENQLYNGTKLSNNLFAIGTLRGGVVIIDREGNLCQILNKNAGLRDERIHFTYTDNHGILWLALNNGLAKINFPSPLSRFTSELGVESTIESIVRHQGTLYAATHLGLNYLQKKEHNFPKFTPFKGISSSVWSLLSVGDYLLAATDAGVYAIKDKDIKLIKSVWSGIGASCLFRSRSNPNIVYVGLFEGLAALQLVGNRWNDLGKFENINEWIVNIDEDENGSLWLGTQYEGILKLDFNSQKVSDISNLKNARITRYDEKYGLPESRISPKFINGKIYFATQKGLKSFNPVSQKFLPDSTFGTDLADTSCWIFKISEDHEGNVWFISGSGYEAKNFKATIQTDGSYIWEDRPFLKFNKLGDILVIFPDTDGVVWFGSSEGIGRFSPQINKNYVVDFQTNIRRVISNNDSVIFYGNPSLNQNQKENTFSLVHNYNSLRFEFAASSYEDISSNQYQYILEGFDEDWSNWNSETRKDYTGLSNGKYQFKVRSRNIYNHISNETQFGFIILPPWYKRWWAQSIFILILGILLFAFDRYHAKKIRRKEQEKAKLKEAEIIQQKNIELQQKNEQLEELLTELKATQTQLVHSEKMAALGKLVSGVVHELNSPLGVINSSSDVSARAIGNLIEILESSETFDEIRKNKRLQKSLNILQNNNPITTTASERISKIVKTLKNFARLDEAEFQEADIQEGLESTLSLLEPDIQDGIEIVENYEDLPKIRCYPGELNQVFMNILTNAIHAMNGKGHISIHTFTKENKVFIQIKDTGSGIPKDQMSQLFDPTFSQKGSRVKAGLSLFTSYNIIQKHHGEIKVESEVDKGSTFTIILSTNL